MLAATPYVYQIRNEESCSNPIHACFGRPNLEIAYRIRWRYVQSTAVRQRPERAVWVKARKKRKSAEMAPLDL
jgi:hypothetical protein